MSLQPRRPTSLSKTQFCFSRTVFCSRARRLKCRGLMLSMSLEQTLTTRQYSEVLWSVCSIVALTASSHVRRYVIYICSTLIIVSHFCCLLCKLDELMQFEVFSLNRVYREAWGKGIGHCYLLKCRLCCINLYVILRSYFLQRLLPSSLVIYVPIFISHKLKSVTALRLGEHWDCGSCTSLLSYSQIKHSLWILRSDS